MRCLHLCLSQWILWQLIKIFAKLLHDKESFFLLCSLYFHQNSNHYDSLRYRAVVSHTSHSFPLCHRFFHSHSRFYGNHYNEWVKSIKAFLLLWFTFIIMFCFTIIRARGVVRCGAAAEVRIISFCENSISAQLPETSGRLPEVTEFWYFLPLLQHINQALGNGPGVALGTVWLPYPCQQQPSNSSSNGGFNSLLYSVNWSTGEVIRFQHNRFTCL